MSRIYDIWNILEASKAQSSGLNKVRYSTSDHADLYLGIKYPEGQRLLLLQSEAIYPGLPGNRNFKGLKLEKIYDTSSTEKIFLSLVLTDNSFSGIFNTIVQDITDAIEESPSSSPVDIFSDRLDRWQAIFEQFAPAGLSQSEQYGLYGELMLLHKLLLQSNSGYGQTIKSWTGPKKAVHDFQYGPWNMEVKVTTGNNHQKIQISNERQLDTSNTSNLFLYHLSLEMRQQAGETLNEITGKIHSLLEQDFAALAKFKTQLAEAGYFEHHRHLYEGLGYIVRQENFYKVAGDFPRIEEKDIRKGVGDVKYSIIVAQFPEYSVPESEILRKFGIND